MTIYDFNETEISGQPLPLAQFKNKVLLIVNTASKCGLAPQLTGLEALHKAYGKKGLVVLGLPSNQFHQELKDDSDVQEYCQMHYGVTFLMTRPVLINGDGEDPLFTYLKEQSGHGRIKWNYTKFLIGKDGQLIKRYAPTTKPEKIEPAIQTALHA